MAENIEKTTYLIYINAWRAFVRCILFSKLIFLTQDFSVEYGENCQFDYVLVESGFKDTKKKLCGPNLSEKAKVQTSMLNKMVIQFHSDPSHNDIGFRAVYKTGKRLK